MDILQAISVVMECVITVLALLIGISRKKPYGYGLAFTFAVYVFYDAAKSMGAGIPDTVLNPLFCLATISALCSVWGIYKDKRAG